MLQRCVRIAFASVSHLFRIRFAFPARSRTVCGLFALGAGSCKFRVNALMAPLPALDLKQRGERFADTKPLRTINAANCGELLVVVGERTRCPIVHDGKQVGAMLLRRQVHGVFEVIAYYERHVGVWLFQATASLTRL